MKTLYTAASCMACVSTFAATYNWSGGGSPNGNWSNPNATGATGVA